MSTAIRFTFNAVKVGKNQTLVYYFVDPDGRIAVSAKEYSGKYPEEVRKAFTVENNTDFHTDYFDKDRFEVFPTHDLYRDVASAALTASRKRLEQAERYQAKVRKTRPNYVHDEMERVAKIVAYLEKVAASKPGEVVPTIADEHKAAREARATKIREDAEKAAAAALAAKDAAPRIVRVTIKWSENSAVSLTCPAANFSTLDSADKHLAQCFNRCPPPVGGGYDKTAFEILWSDQFLYEGRVDVRAVDVATHGHSLIRTHVETFNRNRVAFYGAPGREWVTAEMRDGGIEMCKRLGIEVPPTGEEEARRPRLAVVR